jgi:uncharacterized protein (TIGR02145 family)
MSQNIYQLGRVIITSRPSGYYLRWWYNGWHYWQFLAGGINSTTEGGNYRTRSARTIEINSGSLSQIQVEGLRTILNSREVYLYTDKGWANVRMDAGTVKVYDNKFGGYEMTVGVNLGNRAPSVAAFAFSPVKPPVIIPPDPQCDVTIGTQVWMCKNYDAAYPASRVYNDDEANRPYFGGLYTYAQVMSAGFCPAGYHVPTPAEWQTLIDYCGGNAVAGGVLKKIGFVQWEDPNTGATDARDFSAVGAGAYMVVLAEDLTPNVGYHNLYRYCYHWAAGAGGVQPCFVMAYDTGEILQLPFVPATNPAYTPYFSVRLIKDTPPVEPPVVEPPDETSSIFPPAGGWAWNALTTQRFTVTTAMARWYFYTGYTHSGFTIAVFDPTDTYEITNGVYTTGMVVHVTAQYVNMGSGNNVCQLGVANAANELKCTWTGTQQHYLGAPVAVGKNTNTPYPPSGYTAIFPALALAATPVCSAVASVAQNLGQYYDFYVFAKAIYGSGVRFVAFDYADIVITLNGVRTVIASHVPISNASGYHCAGTLGGGGTWNDGGEGDVTFENVTISSTPAYTTC